MKDKVYINIKGLQFAASGNADDDDDGEAIEVINIGSYKVVNGSEYIRYEEVYEEDSHKSSSIIKIGKNGEIEITKKGAVTAHMSFVQGEKTMTYYSTPYGNLYLGIFSRSVEIIHEEDSIRIAIDYSLELNYEKVSDCKIDINISSSGKFSLEEEKAG